jgi:flagellar biosynthesis protein FliP
MKRLIAVAALAALAALLMLPDSAQAQGFDLGSLVPPGGGTASGRIIQIVALLTVLSIAPGLLIMVTSFTRFVIALSFLRSGLGLQSTPANLVMISLGLFMTFYVMAPTFDKAWQDGIQPLVKNEITEQEAYGKITEPFREFMLAHVREKDLQMFEDLAAETFRPRADSKSIDLRIIIPAFMISELRRAFEIGFLIILPFLVIDMIVATLTMSMGMMMMPPTILALPFKVLFFILIDGWNMLVGGLVRSFM